MKTQLNQEKEKLKKLYKNIELYPEKEQEEIDRLSELIHELEKEDLEEARVLIKVYQEKLDKIINTYEDSIKFWTEECMEKYWKVKLSQGDSLIIFPYKSIRINGTLWGVFKYLDTYHSGLTDGYLPLRTFVGYDIEHIELSKEEFIELSSKNIEEPLSVRLNKLGLL